MTAKKLIGMAVALVVLAGIVMIQRGGNGHASQADSSTTLFEGVDLNAIDELKLSGDSAAVSLKKKDGVWVVTSLYDYPADFNRLADALRTAASVETGRPVRSANVDASEYGFDHARTLRLKSAGKQAAQVEIGAQRAPSDVAGWANQHFVRTDGSDAIYLVDYDFRPFSTDSHDWIDRELLNISPSDIVSVKTGDVELKEIEGTWTLADLDEKTEELQASEAGKLRSALQYLTCTSVAAPDSDLTDPVVYTASTTNKTYTVTVGGETDGKRLIRFSGDVPENLTGWTYEISSYKAENFIIPRDKLVKDIHSSDAQ